LLETMAPFCAPGKAKSVFKSGKKPKKKCPGVG